MVEYGHRSIYYHEFMFALTIYCFFENNPEAQPVYIRKLKAVRTISVLNLSQTGVTTGCFDVMRYFEERWFFQSFFSTSCISTFYASFPRVDDSRFELIKIGAKATGLEPEYHLKNEAWR